ncbi:MULTISPECIES: isochorismate synthase [Aeromonas]|uniref:isochorismate synthase n=1 Tax=Aeromonas TaxID=642 RepID=UPI001B326326|nr:MULTISPECIES: isochorismate synthase [Aeromonas]MBP4041709.1 isochorismate synthase [Aeromonas sp. SrichE-2G]MCO4205143.1 isochorismate synthase [Aeromonas taiwanensis]
MLAQTHLKQQLDALRHSNVSGFVRLRVAASVDAFPGWLAAQTLYPRIYWQARGQQSPEYVALGAIHELTRPEEIQRVCDLAAAGSEDSPRYYGGLAFDPDQPGWQGFGPCRFVLPRVELVRRGECTSLCLNLWLPDPAHGAEFEAELQAAESALDALQPEAPLPVLQKRPWQRRDVPGQAQWQTLVARVTDPGFQARTPKVVLSRESLLESEQKEAPLCPWSLLTQWASLAQECFHFGFQFSPEQSFISCSPERLYRRERGHLFTEALAGTIRRSGDEATDAALAAELLADNKNRLENRLVHADILNRLAPLTTDATLTEPRILKLRLLQHLKCDIEAELKPGVCDWQLLAALHPTPAVGGAPREAALAFIREFEPYDRGWYAGACGMLSRETSEFSVAIRSARIRGQRISLFAGAGIVAGSEPAAEWAELDNKIANVLSLLG